MKKFNKIVRNIAAATALTFPFYMITSCGNGDGQKEDEGTEKTDTSETLGTQGATKIIVSKNDYFTTVAELQGAIAANTLVLLKEYNIQEMMKMVDKKTDLFSTFQTFHPRYGKILVENNPDAFTVAPLSFVVKQDNGKVLISYRKPNATCSGFGLPSSLTDELDQIFTQIAEKASGGSQEISESGTVSPISKNDLITITSANDFFGTVAKLQEAISGNNLVLLKEYNVQLMMKMVDKKIDFFNTYQVFHPRYGKTLVETNQDAFTVTPLNFIVRQDGNKVLIVYKKPSATYSGFGLPSSLTDELDRLFQTIASTAAAKQ